MSFDLSWLSMPVFWLIAAVILAVIEALTMGLTTIWFAGGAVAALGAALLECSLPVQIIVFFVVSVVLLIGTRKIFVGKLRIGQEKTNLDALIDQEAMVIAEIRPMEVGIIRLGGQEWSAVCRDADTAVPAGETVIVKEIEGVKAVVVPLNQGTRKGD